MRTNRRNKDNLYYSSYAESQEVYEMKDGEIQYIEVDGEQVPIVKGIVKDAFSEPVQFRASISATLNEMQAREFGVDQSSIYSTLTASKTLVLKYGDLIWKNSPIRWVDEANLIPDKSSADYVVRGILDEFDDYNFYLLQRNVNK